MKHRMYLAACALLILAVSQLCVAQVYMPQPFSGDLATSNANGSKMTGKFYFSPPNFRMDANSQGHNVSIITNNGTSYVVMHEQHMYMESQPNQANPFMRQQPFMPRDFDPKNPCAWAKEKGASSCKSLGTETVNGRVCDKYQGTSSDGKVTTTGWIDQKLHFPIKAVSSDGSTFDVTNVKEGRPDAALFQPPAGYRKMDIPGMMGGRPPQ
jgi:hypothetical protein